MQSHGGSLDRRQQVVQGLGRERHLHLDSSPQATQPLWAGGTQPKKSRSGGENVTLCAPSSISCGSGGKSACSPRGPKMPSYGSAPGLPLPDNILVVTGQKHLQMDPKRLRTTARGDLAGLAVPEKLYWQTLSNAGKSPLHYSAFGHSVAVLSSLAPPADGWLLQLTTGLSPYN